MTRQKTIHIDSLDQPNGYYYYTLCGLQVSKLSLANSMYNRIANCEKCKEVYKRKFDEDYK